MSKAKAKTKYAKGESRLHYILCVYPCPRYITSGDTHSLCMVCLGATLICLSGGGEASLVPLVDYLAAWKLLPNVSRWVLHTVKKRLSHSVRGSAAAFQRGHSQTGGSRAGSGYGTRSKQGSRFFIICHIHNHTGYNQ